MKSTVPNHRAQPPADTRRSDRPLRAGGPVVLALALLASASGVVGQSRDGLDMRVVSDAYQVRVAALGEIRNMTPRRRRSLTGPLVRLLSNPTVRRDGAAEALALIGSPATRALLKALEDPDPEVRMYAADALGGIAPPSPEVVRALTRRVRDPDREVQDRAVQALGRIGPAAAPALPVLLDALERRGDRPTTTLVQALGRIGPAAISAVPTLIEVLDEDPYSVAAVAEALGSLGGGARLAVPHLLGALARAVAESPEQDASGYERDVIVRSLASIGGPAVGPLRAALADPDPSVREASAEALGRMGSPAVDARLDLESRLEDPAPFVRAAAVAALGSMGSAALGSAPALEARLADPNAFVRARAADALVALGDRASLRVVERYRAYETTVAEADDPDQDLRSVMDVRAARPATARYQNPLELAREVVLETAEGVALTVTIHSGPERPDLLAVWRAEGDNLRRLLSWEGESGARFEPPHSFTYRGALLLHLQLRHPRAGNFHEDVVYHVSPGGELYRVRLTPPGEQYLPALAPGEAIWKGPGYDFGDDSMSFSFGIWREGDASCCPSGGRVSGVFELMGTAGPAQVPGAYRSTYRIVPKAFTRLPSGSW